MALDAYAPMYGPLLAHIKYQDLVFFNHYLSILVLTWKHGWLCVSIGVVFRDERSVFFVCCLPSVMSATVLDALPQRLRVKTTLIFYFFNLMAISATATLIYFNLGSVVDFAFKFREVRVTAFGIAYSCLANMAIFGMKNLASIIRHPGCYVLVNSRIENLKVNQTEYVSEIQRHDSRTSRRKGGSRKEGKEADAKDGKANGKGNGRRHSKRGDAEDKAIVSAVSEVNAGGTSSSRSSFGSDSSSGDASGKGKGREASCVAQGRIHSVSKGRLLQANEVAALRKEVERLAKKEDELLKREKAVETRERAILAALGTKENNASGKNSNMVGAGIERMSE